MRIVYYKVFEKHFKERIVSNKKLREKFYQRLDLLIENPQDEILRCHQLKGNKKFYCSFSVTGDIRVIYRIENDTLFLYDIGSHAQVY